MEKIGGDGERLKRDGGLLGVELDETDEKVDAGGEGIMPDDTVGGRRHDGCFESGDGLF